VILTAHPVANFEKWFTKFVRCVDGYSKQTLSDFLSLSHEYLPIKPGFMFEEGFAKKEVVRT
jgi:hypothetical protein